MEEPLAIPASISYRQLQTLAQSAPADMSPSHAGSGSETAALDSALEAWSRSSQELLQRLQDSLPALLRLSHKLDAAGGRRAHGRVGATGSRGQAAVGRELPEASAPESAGSRAQGRKLPPEPPGIR